MFLCGGYFKVVFSGCPQCVCEIRKIEVFAIDFSTPVAFSERVNLGAEFTKSKTAGLGAILRLYVAISRNRGFYRPKVRIANPQISGGSGAQRPGNRPTRVLHATVPSAVRVRHASKRPNLSRPRGVVELGTNDERFRSPKTRYE